MFPAITLTLKKTWKTSGKSMKSIVRLLRVKHWVKNLFLFIPNFFAGGLFHSRTIKTVLAGVILFSLVASAIYIINDLRDVKKDRLHPRKKFRPLASGEVKQSTAIILSVVLLITGMTLSALITVNFFYLLLLYFAINLAYSFGLKNIPLIDLFVVASGFLIRIYCGGILGDVPISHWLAIMIFLLALFLVLAKRRDDLIIHTETGNTVRTASKSYNLEFVNSCLTIFSAVIVVSYIMYTVSPEVIQRFGSDMVFATSAFVIAGIMRYLQITFVEQNSGSPTSILYKDKFILFTILGWIFSFFLIIYIYKL